MSSLMNPNEEDAFELVDLASSDGDSVSNLSYVEVHNEEKSELEQNEEIDRGSTQASAVAVAKRAAAPAAEAVLHDQMAVADNINKKPQDGDRQLSVEAGIKSEKKGTKLPAPRLIRVELNDDETDCGIGIFKSVYFYVETVKKGSAAYRAGVPVAARIYFVNGVATKGLKTAGVVDLLIAAGNCIELLILQDPDGLYEELGIPVSLVLPNIVRGATPRTVLTYKIPLERRTATAEYGFSTSMLDSTLVSSVDANGAEYRAGLRERMRIAAVDDLIILENIGYRKVKKILKEQPISSTLWIIPKREKTPKGERTNYSILPLYLTWLVVYITALTDMYNGLIISPQVLQKAIGWPIPIWFLHASIAISVVSIVSFKVFPRIVFVKTLYNFIWLCYLIGSLSAGPIVLVPIVFRAISVACDVLSYKKFMRTKKDLAPLYAEARVLKKAIAENEKKTKMNDFKSFP
ncbi:hypothetical protein PFISCL1PPCAC_8489 [Pristionchus fissidentatus]|uniref:PDZ domain-containing protein n=1 Tax=Pristionchus fissidentatus TaxID=1538716 RepID=A0AAV5VEM9_9BILA|nr:hypothetical protein PFISCL1PPCAC_8489 [Pristionchus fissidentatus]